MSWRDSFLGWLGESSDHVESDTPKGWYIRGFAIAILIAAPVALWLVGHRSGGHPEGQWAMGVCPPVVPIPRSELVEHPMRFRHRFVWITGRVRYTDKRCVKFPCAKGKECCHPCQATLVMGRPPHQVTLEGLLPSRSRGHRRVVCQGTTCKLDCRPFVPGRVYAVAGRPVLGRVGSSTPSRRGLLRPRFRLRAFKIHRYCVMHAALPIYQRRRLPEPPMGRSKSK